VARGDIEVNGDLPVSQLRVGRECPTGKLEAITKLEGNRIAVGGW
jgi:hypothetical protein